MEGERSEGNREQRSREKSQRKEEEEEEEEEGGRLVSSIYNIILENVGRRSPKLSPHSGSNMSCRMCALLPG